MSLRLDPTPPTQRRARSLAFALLEADVARAARSLEYVATGLADLAAGVGGGMDGIGLLARRTRNARAEEGLIAGPMLQEVRLDSLLTRLVTLRLASSSVLDRAVTALAPMRVDGWAARGLAVVAREIIHSLETESGDQRTELMVALEWDGGRPLLALAASGPGVRPVPSAAGAAAMARARRIVRLLRGGVGRGMADGRIVVGVSLDWPAVTSGRRRDA